MDGVGESAPQKQEKSAARELSNEETKQAAEVIQRNYRGYRMRRQLNGMGLDPSTRWYEAVKEARYRQATRPLTHRRIPTASSGNEEEDRKQNSKNARHSWKRITEIARHAGSDDVSDTEDEDDMTEEQREEHRRKKAEARREREKTAKLMDLQYFLEMVDEKHRYGSNLRAYHQEWKSADTNENFFYWLDQGEGKNVELPTVSRERLEKEQVRYLSREERYKYLVEIDKEGKLRWAKNGELVSTSVHYKDSVEGIVPKDDETPEYARARRSSTSSSSSSSSDSAYSSQASAEGDHYVNRDLKEAKGFKKIQHVSAATILDHLLRGTVKPNTWIFVADTSFRLYVGIKQSGAFQHSSFLRGARISAAGTIKVKNGQLRRLSPLSGHYRAPTANFRNFVHALKKEGVDLSRVSISRSYAVLLGIETYKKTRKKIKHGLGHAGDTKDKVVHPEEARRREEAETDKSKSAQMEREALAAEAKSEEQGKKQEGLRSRFMRKVRLSVSHGSGRDSADGKA